jgi:hypothetical protein
VAAAALGDPLRGGSDCGTHELAWPRAVRPRQRRARGESVARRAACAAHPRPCLPPGSPAVADATPQPQRTPRQPCGSTAPPSRPLDPSVDSWSALTARQAPQPHVYGWAAGRAATSPDGARASVADRRAHHAAGGPHADQPPAHIEHSSHTTRRSPRAAPHYATVATSPRSRRRAPGRGARAPRTPAPERSSTPRRTDPAESIRDDKLRLRTRRLDSEQAVILLVGDVSHAEPLSRKQLSNSPPMHRRSPPPPGLVPEIDYRAL